MFVSPAMLLPYFYWKMWMNMVTGQSLPAAQRTVNDVAEAGLDATIPPTGYVG
jgi:hypothetical protein